jgi:hypothetical protein
MLRRRTFVALIALTLVLLVRPVAVAPAMACSCAMFENPMAGAAKEPRGAVFSGVVGVPTPEGVPVGLTRWFKGSPPAAVVMLDSRGFDDPMGGSCGTNRPPAGSEWIFIAWLNERARFDVNLCSVHADLATPEGQTLLKEAAAVFGPTQPLPVATAEPVPLATARAVPAATADPGAPAPDGPRIPAGVLLMAGGGTLLAVLGAGLALYARRRSGDR